MAKKENVYSYTNAKGKTYYLHGRDTVLKNGTESKLYFFAGDVREGAMTELPEGREVSETKNGMPVLKKAQ